MIISTDEGALWISDAGGCWYPNLEVDTIDTTGAGDAFAGALAVAIVERRAMAEAISFAHAAAAIATTKAGALPSLPTHRELDDFLRTTGT